jgi:hypothetical protein
MKNVGLICTGVVIGFGVAMLLGFTTTQGEGRYQLCFGKAEEFFKNKDGTWSTSEPSVCFKINTLTGETYRYRCMLSAEKTGSVLEDRFVKLQETITLPEVQEQLKTNAINFLPDANQAKKEQK